jgi:His Kinase A (phospho-acceptor) domain
MIIRPVRKRLAGACRLRSALLTSISHDLKTPLAAVLGAAGTLRSLSDGLDQHAKADLLATIIDEAERLNRFIANLLDMTKLESGAIVPNAAMHDLGEIIGSALERSSKILVQHRVEVDLAKELPMVEIDPVLFEQVTCWIMRQSMLRPELPSESRAGTIGTPLAYKSWTRVKAFRPAISSTSLTSSIGRARPITCERVPDWVSRFLVVSWKLCRAPFRRRTAWIGGGRVYDHTSDPG